MGPPRPRQFTVPKKFCKIIKKESLNREDIINVLEQNQKTIKSIYETRTKTPLKCKELVKSVSLSNRLRGILKKTCSLIRKGKSISKTCTLE